MKNIYIYVKYIEKKWLECLESQKRNKYPELIQ